MRKLTTLFSLTLLGTFFLYNFADAQMSGVSVGDVAPKFNLKNIDGKMVALDDYAEEDGAIVIFTCNHCPYSVKYEDRIIALDKRFKDHGYPVIAINPNDPKAYPSDDFANMQKRAEKKGFTFPYLVDESQDIAKAYGATRTPHIFFLQKSGSDFVVKYIGAIDDAAGKAENVDSWFLEDALHASMRGKEVETDKTKAIGCSIKWKK
ncbi:MAG: thioredoxin family protein [Bacteroidota bacterium]